MNQRPKLTVIAGRPIHTERNTQMPPAPPAPPTGRVVREGFIPRPASNAPIARADDERDHVQDAVNFMDVAAIIGAGMIVLGLLVFVWWFAPVVKQ